MLNIERYNLILELLKRKKNVKLSELTEELNISEATVRRDLNFLEEKGKIKRIHGGAILVDKEEEDIDYKKLVYNEEKNLIALKAINYIKDGDTIYLDGGTTVGALIPHLNKFSNLKIVTNSYFYAEELSKISSADTYLLGGKLKSRTGATVGVGAVHNLQQYNFDLVFIGANGVDENGYYTPDPEEMLVKSEAIKKGNEVYFLCDHTKFYQKSFTRFAELEDGILLSNQNIPKDFIIKKRGD